MLLPTLLLTTALPATILAATPVPPTLTHLFSVNLTFSAPITIGSVPYGSRDLLFISGGTFSGPKLSGTLPSPRPLPPQHSSTGSFVSAKHSGHLKRPPSG